MIFTLMFEQIIWLIQRGRRKGRTLVTISTLGSPVPSHQLCDGSNKSSPGLPSNRQSTGWHCTTACMLRSRIQPPPWGLFPRPLCRPLQSPSWRFPQNQRPIRSFPRSPPQNSTRCASPDGRPKNRAQARRDSEPAHNAAPTVETFQFPESFLHQRKERLERGDVGSQAGTWTPRVCQRWASWCFCPGVRTSSRAGSLVEQ